MHVVSDDTESWRYIRTSTMESKSHPAPVASREDVDAYIVRSTAITANTRATAVNSDNCGRDYEAKIRARLC